jgi:UDP-N-acetylmuramoylalanine--D-glutamate ligase
MQLSGKHITVMGLGVHGGGLGVARYCAEHGAYVTVTDLRSADVLQDSLAALADLPITYVLGEHRAQDFETCDIVVRNPAVPDSSPYLQMAYAAGVAVEMEMTIFFRQCPAPIIGITGTKGKTTTATLVAHLLKQWRADTILAGNMRISALAQLADITPQTLVVLELSSFVLEGLDRAGLSPAIAAITNIHPDHLDRYGTMAAYTAAKAAIGRHQRGDQQLVLGYDSAALHQLAPAMPGHIRWSGMTDEVPATDGNTWWHADILYAATAAGVLAVAQASDLQLLGAHNRANVAIAVGVALAAGMPLAEIAPALRSFAGVEHRQERVVTIAGKAFVNDTAATMPEAAMAALACMPQPIVWIAGGADKKLQFDELAQVAAQYAHQVVLLDGSATARLQAACEAAGMADRIVGVFADFDAAVRAAYACAPVNATVLLSPGCASFGMFRNEFHRGEEFRRIVAQIGAEEAS